MRDILCHFSPSLSLPLTPPLSFTLSVCTSLSLLVYYVSCHTSLFLCVFLYIWFMEPNRTHHPYVWSLFLSFSAPFTAAPPPPSPAIPLLLFLSFHTAQTMQFKKSWCNIMQTVREPPLEDSLQHLDTEPKAIWLELLRSGWSAVIFQPVQILFTLMASELLPRKLELDEDWPELLYSTLCAFSSFF